MINLKDMSHATLLLYKGKWTSLWVQESPLLTLSVTIASREHGIPMVTFYESKYENYKLIDSTQQQTCSIDEFKLLLLDKYSYNIGSIIDNGDVDAHPLQLQ